MHTRIVTFLFRLIVACGILLALPGSAMAAPMAISGPASVSETAGKATYTVTCGDTPALLPMLPPVPNTGPLNVAVTDGPAPPTQAADYGAPTQTLLTCSIATTEFTFDVPIVNDALDELNEKFTVTASGVLVAEGPVSKTVVTTITDDDPIASITPLVRVVEGDSGTSAAELTVTLATPRPRPRRSATQRRPRARTAGPDFTATTGQRRDRRRAQPTGTISIPIVGDTTPEAAEVFFVNLATTNNGSLSPTQNRGMVVIFDNEKAPLPTVSLPKTTSANENDGNVSFNVTLSSAATQRTEVSWKTVDWTAKKPSDYKGANGKVVFQTGDRTKTISVDLKNDSRDEPDEALGVVLENPVAATLGQRGGFGADRRRRRPEDENRQAEGPRKAPGRSDHLPGDRGQLRGQAGRQGRQAQAWAKGLRPGEGPEEDTPAEDVEEGAQGARRARPEGQAEGNGIGRLRRQARHHAESAPQAPSVDKRT